MFNLMMELVVFAMLCFSTQGRLVQVSSNRAMCPDDVAVFWCTTEMGFLIWDIRTRTGLAQSLSLHSGQLTTETVTLNSSSLVGQVTFTNGSFINATVTIMRPINLNGSTVTCNRDTLTLNVPTSGNIGTPLAALNISLEGTNMLDIHWEPEGNCYYIQLCTHPGVTESRNSVTTASYILPLENKTYEITISLHPEMNIASNFTIGPCLFNDKKIMERQYKVYQNSSWTISQKCNNSVTLLHTNCESNGRWSTEITCTKTQVVNIIETTSMNEEKTSKRTLISSLISIGVITTIVIIVTITVVSLIRKKRKKISRPQTDTSEMTYQFLSNKYHNRKPNTSSRQMHTANTEMHDQGEYSSLHHNKPFLPSNDEYATVTNTHQPETSKSDVLQYGSIETKSTSKSETSYGYSSTSHPAHAKTKKLKYTDVDTPGHNGPMGCDLIHIKVDYADINLRARPEDENLNLNSLLIQLNPMSKDFRLFGSVAGISPDTLDKIVASCAAPYDGLVEVCDAWLDKCRKEKTTPTWNAVADILSLIGQDKLSHDIMQVYTTGKLPIEVDMNSLDVQGEVRLPSPPPPIPPYREESNEDTGSDIELMTVTSVMTTRQLPASRDTAMEEPPPIPKKLHDIMPADENEEPQQALSELPPKLPVKDQQRKPIPAKRKQSKDGDVIPSLPPRPPKNT